MASRWHVCYSRLAADEDNDYHAGGYDPRYDYTPKSFDKVPWKSIFLALFLLSLRCVWLEDLRRDLEKEREKSHGRRTIPSLWSFRTWNSYFPPRDFMRLELHIIRGGVPKDITSLPSQIFEDMHNALENV
ncbi:unnamed protein product [Camellia sinensis]